MKKIAIPIENGQLCAHFGHCQQFAIVVVNDDQTMQESSINPPPHEPGLLPKWLAERGVTNVIAAGIGQKAIQLFNQQHIEVAVGVPANTPQKIVEDWLSNSLKMGVNACDH
ncbi:NifB/NifX family molybdenum-iron cluster-binding protein [Sunxiuqinia sp. A32]|uniref:NifB/NifX family molybdenum-iron cluster-binding protein n=1 Tax=Sunxiuqinia sp. A32 TaxID=3461496 RepID=UPI0040451F8E